MDQLLLFPEGQRGNLASGARNSAVPLDRYEGALTFGAIGDALGWPTEFGRYPRSVAGRPPGYRLDDFVSWHKVVGGRFWGYEERIEAGEYSDDTQLTLAVARCIDDQGRFSPEKFAYFELPLWLSYEKGGGRSIKTATRHLVRLRKDPWPCAFYRQKTTDGLIDYREAGANGAAMRVLPIALAHAEDSEDASMLRDAFANSITTHGHPRAILGCLLHAGLLWRLLRSQNIESQGVMSMVSDLIAHSTVPMKDVPWISNWLTEWDKTRTEGTSFRAVFEHVRAEARGYLEHLSRLETMDTRTYYKLVGASGGPFKGSGLSTVFAAIYLFLKFRDNPELAVITAVNELGSDTDTIAAFVGALFGAHFGTSVIPTRWKSRIQDAGYLERVAHRMYRIANREENASITVHDASSWEQVSSLSSVYSWQTRLFSLFLCELDCDETVVHPALGVGKVMGQEARPLLKRPDYEVRLVQVDFVDGQKCRFHARVALKTGEVSESENLSQEIEHNREVVKSLTVSA